MGGGDEMGEGKEREREQKEEKEKKEEEGRKRLLPQGNITKNISNRDGESKACIETNQRKKERRRREEEKRVNILNKKNKKVNRI